MKVAYILYPEVIISNKSNGIRSQAEAWAKILENKGVHVDLVNNWENYDWSHYDAIHFLVIFLLWFPKDLVTSIKNCIIHQYMILLLMIILYCDI